MTARVNDAGVYNELSSLTSLKRDAQAQDPSSLREVAKQFESLFTRMVLKSMREASFGDALLGSDQQSFYQGMYDDQLAVELSKGRGLGLADMLVKQLSQAGLAPKPADAAAGTAAVDVSAPSTAAWLPENKHAFVRDLWPAAQEAGEALGVDPKILIAQAALESNWGRSMPRDAQGNASFNLFGIKAGDQWSGKASVASTVEVESGVAVNRRERFRAYDSPVESFKDYVALLRNNPRYTEALNHGDDAHAFASALQRGGYATDPAYATKVASIAQNLWVTTTSLKYASAVPMTSSTRTL